MVRQAQLLPYLEQTNIAEYVDSDKSYELANSVNVGGQLLPLSAVHRGWHRTRCVESPIHTEQGRGLRRTLNGDIIGTPAFPCVTSKLVSSVRQARRNAFSIVDRRNGDGRHTSGVSHLCAVLRAGVPALAITPGLSRAYAASLAHPTP